MQAALIFAFFGIFMAVIGGITSNSTDSTRQLMLNYTQQTKDFFHAAEKILVASTVPDNMEVPAPATSCNGSSSDSEGTAYTAKSVGPYLCRRELAQLATWSFANSGTNDPWGRPFQGIVITRDMSVAPGVEAPVTAFALVSSGPDRQMGANLQAAINNAVSTIDGVTNARQAIMRVMRLTPDLDTAAGNDTDDIAYTFTTQRAQEERWAAIEGAVNRIGVAALRNYQQQFMRYQASMPTLYNSNISSYFNTTTGVVNITTSTLNLWKNQTGATVPTMASPDLNTTAGRYQLGVDQEFNLITQTVANGGSGMRLTTSVADSTYGSNDILTLQLTNSSSPWGSGAGAVGNISFTVVVTGGGS